MRINSRCLEDASIEDAQELAQRYGLIACEPPIKRSGVVASEVDVLLRVRAPRHHGSMVAGAMRPSGTRRVCRCLGGPMMTTDELATAVLAMRKREHVSFAELAREWPEHFRDGRFEIRSSVAPNLVIWVGVSETCADALEKIKNRTVAYEAASSPLVYLIDGCTLNYPLAKAKSRKALHSYKRPHWIPTVMRPIERARPSQL